MVYLSDATEWGAVYSKGELIALSQCCRELGLFLFLDGARLAQALAVSDLTLTDVAALTDAFSIGGTKNGAMFGEALVLVNPALQPHFRTLLKQRGGMLAKGRMLGIQFEELFRDDLYVQLGRQAVERAARLQNGLRGLGYPMYVDSPTNQIFPIVPDSLLPCLDKLCTYEVWGKADENHTVIRLVTSFATPLSSADGLLNALKDLKIVN
jgi:threonine aldolase